MSENNPDRPAFTLCAHSREYLPTWDHYLLQKLAIEADEKKFLKTAYRSTYY